MISNISESRVVTLWQRLLRQRTELITEGGELTSHPELKRKTLTLYRHYPKLAVNAIERHMKNQLGVNSSLANSAQRQQGLIHIYHTLCAQGRCGCCPLSHLETRDHIQV